MAGFHVFQDLFEQIDAILQAFVTDASSKAVATVMPFVVAGVTIVLLWQAFAVMLGRLQQPVGTLLMRCLGWSLIVSAALAAGAYQENVADMVRSLPNDVAAELAPGKDSSGDSMGSLLDKIADNGITKAKEAFNTKTGTFEYMKALVFVSIGVGILIMTLALSVAGAIMLMLANTAISFLAALGPFFIAALLFDSTRNFFWTWVSQVLYWVAFMVMFALFATFTMNTYDFYMQSVKVDGTEHSWIATVFAANVVATFGMIMFFWIPKIASALTQGTGGSVAGAVGGVIRTALTTMAIVKTAGAAGALGAGAGAARSGAGAAAAANQARKPATDAPRNYNRQ